MEKQKLSTVEEEIILHVYAINNAISYARNPLFYQGEGSTRKKMKDESKDEEHIRNTFYVPIERFESRVETLDMLPLIILKARLHFPDVVKGLETINRLIIEIHLAVRRLINSKNRLHEIDADENIIWFHGAADDEIHRQQIKAVENIEVILKKYL